jgi:hypothetical protein
MSKIQGWIDFEGNLDKLYDDEKLRDHILKKYLESNKKVEIKV